MKKFCLQCGRVLKSKGRRSPNLCEQCLLAEYNRLKKNGESKKEKGQEKEEEVKVI